MTLAKCHLLCHLLVQFVWAIGSNHGFSASLHTIRWCNSTSIYVSTSETARANKLLNERETRLEFISSPSLPIITIFQVGRPGYLNCESMRSAWAIAVCMAFFLSKAASWYTPRSTSSQAKHTSTHRNTSSSTHAAAYKLTSTRNSTQQHKAVYETRWCTKQGSVEPRTRRCTKQGGVRNKAV